MKKIYVMKPVMLMLLMSASFIMIAGCGGGSDSLGSTNSACVKNPLLCLEESTVTVSGRVFVPAGLISASKSVAEKNGGEQRAASFTTEALSGAVIQAGYLNTYGTFVKDDTTTYATTNSNGSYTLSNVSPGDNVVIRATYSTSTTTYTLYNIMTISSSYMGSLYSATDSTAETTLAVAAVRKIIEDYNDASTTDISSDDLSTGRVDDIVELINDNLQSQVTLGNVNVNNVLLSDTAAETQLTNLSNEVDELKIIVAQESAVTSGDPYVVAFMPADGKTGVEYNGTTFSVVFSERMNTSITPSGFSITLQNDSTGSYLTISDINATAYGYFMWDSAAASNGSTAYINDMLSFVLNSNTTLKGNGLSTLSPGTTYNITAITVPSNLKDLGGAALKTSTGIPTKKNNNTYGSFTTKN